jgi:hypothetical protein
MRKMAVFVAVFAASLASALGAAQARCHVVNIRGGLSYGSYSGPPDALVWRKLGSYRFGQALNVDHCSHQLNGQRGYFCRLIRTRNYVYHSDGRRTFTEKISDGPCTAASY